MTRIIDGVAYYTVNQAAAIMTTTALRVLMLMREQTLAGMQFDGEWMVNADSVASWLAEGGDLKRAIRCGNSCASVHGCGCGSGLVDAADLK